MTRTTIRCKFVKRGRVVTTTPAAPARPTPAKSTGPSRGARMLALAHHVERLIEAGEIADYAEAARALGLTRARMTQVTKLLMLSPEIQERILVGTTRGSERRLRRAVGEVEWAKQAACKAAGARE